SRFLPDLLAGTLEPLWAKVEMVSDDPRKGLGQARDQDLLAHQLRRILARPPRASLDLVSPYFVPTDAGVEVFARLAAAMGRPELGSDERYATHRARGARQEELDSLIGEWTKTMTIAELEARMIEAGVPAGRVFDAEDMMADPHFAARDALVTVDDAEFGEVTMQGVFPRLSDTPGSIRRPAPLVIGQDTADVLKRWLGREA
ncbi:MAG: hypothetical protein E2577_13010, partial [Starkeya sp.]|nr:hypothetical protein [Starkeya sp.]